MNPITLIRDRQINSQFQFDSSPISNAVHGQHMDQRIQVEDRVTMNLRFNTQGNIMNDHSDFSARGRFEGIKTRAKIGFDDILLP